MKHLIIAAATVWAVVHFGSMLFLSKDHAPDDAFGDLLQAPQRVIHNPYKNGYFYLFGLTAAATLDPAKTGYEIWIEASEDARRGASDDSKGNRGNLAFTVSLEPTIRAWESDDPLTEFRKKESPLRDATSHYQILLTRYDRWADMPFDDWGYGYRVVPLGTDIMAIHRLYVADGFSMNTGQGLDRLRKDFHLWRTVLRDAKTIETKVLAQVIITDDLKLLSRILAKPTIDKAILTMGLQLTLPLSEAEYSLRWPIMNELALAARTGRMRNAGHTGKDTESEEWLLRAAHLPIHAFDGVQHPAARSPVIYLKWGQASNAYSAYYDAVIKASETSAKALPRMQEVIGTVHRGLMESMLVPHPIEPDWELFHSQLVQTDTRLRLASLQIQLRRPSVQTAIPTRLAQVGSQYFDPFTGLPMLWSPTQQKLYSVGKDRLDDGGDPTFDISVPAIVTTTQHTGSPVSRTIRNR